MKAKVFYQDFFNSTSLSKTLIVEKEKSALMKEFIFSDGEAENVVCDKIYHDMNIGDFLSTPEFQDKVKNQPFKGKHTSMSVGDFVEFENGNVWVCDVVGWKKIEKVA